MSEDNEIDFEADGASGSATDNELRTVATLAEQWVEADADVKNLEEQLKLAKERTRVLEQQKIPDAMDALGLSSFSLSSGHQIVVEDKVHANIPKNRSQQAYAWLREHNFGSLIKNKVEVVVPKGRDEDAQKAMELLQTLGLDPTIAENVPWNTLTSWAKEQLARGENLPLELLGIFVGRVAKIK